MTTSPYLIATTAAALSTAVSGGVFYAFSTIVMRGLDRTDPVDALTAMRGINAEAPSNAPFLILFVGSSALALGVGITAALRLSQPGSGYVLAGAALGVVAFLVTAAFNIPLNNRLDALSPETLQGLSDAEALREWKAYLVPWTAWNHVRTLAPIVGSVLMVVGLARGT